MAFPEIPGHRVQLKCRILQLKLDTNPVYRKLGKWYRPERLETKTEFKDYKTF